MAVRVGGVTATYERANNEGVRYSTRYTLDPLFRNMWVIKFQGSLYQ